ncbi:MAG: MgtC/SapB family protein [Calditerrivibrio sp.]|nr:MgtC/SapB family protein [Calditerrivibrio sp.]
MFFNLNVLTNLLTALGLGILIGLERQIRQRAAGLRTNTLVSLGSAAFVILTTLVEGENSPTRIAAQVVSGIGFLGAGLIIRESSGIRGLNTAATLWCSASVGVLAGSGHTYAAVATTILVLLSNILLRPIAIYIDRFGKGANELEQIYIVKLKCLPEGELHLRTLLVQMLAPSHLLLRSLHSEDIDEGKKVCIKAEVIANIHAQTILEDVVSRLSLESSVSSVSWEIQTNQE